MSKKINYMGNILTSLFHRASVMSGYIFDYTDSNAL
jgi:hypothetical protein